MPKHLIIIGGGQAAAQAVQTLRQNNYGGRITLVSEEHYVPYQRPPLSKKYLAGELPPERLHFKADNFYDAPNVVTTCPDACPAPTITTLLRWVPAIAQSLHRADAAVDPDFRASDELRLV